MSGRRFEDGEERRHLAGRSAAFQAAAYSREFAGRMPANLPAGSRRSIRVTIVTPPHDTRHAAAMRAALALPREHRSVQRTSRAAEGGPIQLSLHGRVSPCFLTFPSGHESQSAGRMGTALQRLTRSALLGSPSVTPFIRSQVFGPAIVVLGGVRPRVSSITWRCTPRHPLPFHWKRRYVCSHDDVMPRLGGRFK